MATAPGIVLVCGRYEGFDERLIEAYADDVMSLEVTAHPLGCQR